MEPIKKVSLIGTGAIGGTFASQLYDSIGDDLRIITDEKRYERYSKNGFIINERKYDFNYVKADDEVEPADLLLIAVKYHHLETVLDQIKNHVGDHTIILSLLNGINSETIVGEQYGMDKMLYSLVFRVDATREGNIITHSLPGTIVFGEKNNTEYSERVLKVKDLFDSAGIHYQIPEDMMYKLWWKFMVNVGINQTSAILRAPYKVFQEQKEALDLLKDTMREVISLANALGIDLKEDDMQEFIDLLYDLSGEGRTSMLQDVLAHRKTEVEMFAKVVCDLGEQHNVSTPINKMLYRMLKTIENTY